MPFTPRNSRVLIRRDQRAEETSGGIILPAQARELPQNGTVLAVGPGDRHPVTGERIPVGFEVGDKVVFLKYAGTEIEVDGEEGLICIVEKDVLGVLTE